MQFDREYLFIEEAENYAGFTKFDLIDYLNQGRLELYAWISKESLYGFCRIDNNAKQSIIGCFDYKGIIKIPNHLTSLISKTTDSVEIENFELVQKEFIYNWRDQKPHTFTYPNKDFSEYRFLADFTNYEIEPLLGPLDSFERQSYTFELTHDHKNTCIQDFSDDEYSKQALIITLPELRIKRSQLDRLILQNARTSVKTKLPDALIEKQISPLEELLKRIVRHGFTSGSEVIRILIRESKIDEDDRLYDTYKILLEADNANVVWQDRNQEAQTSSKKTILNKVSELKKQFS